MKEIKLTQGYVALVDDEDFERVNALKWNVRKHTGHEILYAARSGFPSSRNTGRLMHRFIMDVEITNGNRVIVDHINHNGLDNQKGNLRICSSTENSYNRRINKNSTSTFKGVSLDNHRNKWASYIFHNKKKKFLGYFNNEIDAAKAYDNKAKELFGEFSFLNFPSHDKN